MPILDDSCIFTSSLTHFSFESNRIASKFGGAKLMQIANFCDWRVLIWLSMHNYNGSVWRIFYLGNGYQNAKFT